MHLMEMSRFPLFSFSPLKQHPKSFPKDMDLIISRSFDEAVLRGLKALDPPSISLFWFSRAVDFLALIHTEAITMTLDESQLACSTRYLDNTVKILDICNSISSEIERLRHRRLVTNFLLHLLKSDPLPDPEKLRRARDSISAIKGRGFPMDLLRDLSLLLGNVPRGETSTIRRRTIYAVGLLTAFIAGVIVSGLYGSPSLIAFRVPSEFLWADAFNGIQSTISSELKRRFGGQRSKEGCFEELDDVESRIRQVCDVIDLSRGDRDKENDKREEKLNGAVRELERVVETFSERLDRLSDGVNGIFQTVLCSRKGMLENLRVGEEKKQTKRK